MSKHHYNQKIFVFVGWIQVESELKNILENEYKDHRAGCNNASFRTEHYSK